MLVFPSATGYMLISFGLFLLELTLWEGRDLGVVFKMSQNLTTSWNQPHT